MIKVVIISLFGLLLLREGACQKRSGNSSSKSSQVKSEPFDTTNAEFSVSFVSKGSGINRNAHRTFLNLLKEFEKQNQIVLNHQRKNWGKEGEKTYCFKNQPKIKELRDYLEKELKNFDRINFSDKAECE